MDSNILKGLHAACEHLCNKAQIGLFHTGLNLLTRCKMTLFVKHEKKQIARILVATPHKESAPAAGDHNSIFIKRAIWICYNVERSVGMVLKR